MVLSLVTDILTGAPCTLELQLDAEANRKSTFLTKDRYGLYFLIFHYFLELVRRHSFTQMVRIYVVLQAWLLNPGSELNTWV